MQNHDVEKIIIAYNSVAFSKAMCNVSVIEKELAAMRWAVKSFRLFIYGVPVIFYTDHKPLTYLKNMKNNTRIDRTMRELEEYDLEIRYCRGCS